jgi:hypothetical protein
VLLLLSSQPASAAPALVWKTAESAATRSTTPCVHSSDEVTAATIFEHVLGPTPNDSELAAVVFLLGRGDKGSERLSTLTKQGSLPGVAAKYDEADAIYYSVTGNLHAQNFASAVTRSSPAHKVVQLSFGEFMGLTLSDPQEMEISGTGVISKSTKTSKKKARALKNAHILVVDVDASIDPAAIDLAVVNAIEDKSIQSVVLSALRSTDEVKFEREVEYRHRQDMQEAAGRRVLAAKANGGRRRLDQGDDAADDGSDYSSVVFVSMTPNILAGLLFFLLFTTVVYIGVGCMGMISGQDVYVSKMPSIGREM